MHKEDFEKAGETELLIMLVFGRLSELYDQFSAINQLASWKWGELHPFGKITG